MSIGLTKPSFKIWTEHQVLFATVSGAWNKSIAVRYIEEFKTQAQSLTSASWAHCSYLNQWQLATPDSEPLIRNLESWCIGHNVKYAAVIYAASSIKQFQLQKMLKATAYSSVFRHFTNSQDAIRWLNERGFETNSTSVGFNKAVS